MIGHLEKFHTGGVKGSEHRERERDRDRDRDQEKEREQGPARPLEGKGSKKGNRTMALSSGLGFWKITSADQHWRAHLGQS